MATRRADSGFTLLEALLVLAIFALIVVGTLPLIRLATDQVARSRSDETATREVAQLEMVLTSILARAQPPSLGRADGPFQLSGSPESIEFVAPLPQALGGGFARYTLAITGEGALKRLILTWQRRDAAASTAVLLEPVSSMSITYLLESVEVGGPSDWADRADGVKQRVRAVRLIVTSESIGTFDRIVPLLIDRNRSCVFDTVAFDCRPGA